MSVRLGLLHPGEMGSSLGACALRAGCDVSWSEEGRSDATRERAERDGLRAVPTLDALLAVSDVVLSVCPPASAETVARRVAATGFGGLYVDANAVSPETAERIAGVVGSAGARYVDAGLVGPPARAAGRCVMYTSGPASNEVAPLFAGSDLEVTSLGDGVGSASALKMAYAAYTKGHSALLLDVRALARACDVEAPLLAHWQRTHPELAALSEGTARATARKAWRFAGEMEEIASTFASAGLPDDFHRGAAAVYERMGPLQHAEAPSLDDVLAALLRARR